MICERCNAADGREVATYKLTDKGNAERVLCESCAVLTEEHHKIEPSARAVPAGPTGRKRSTSASESTEESEA